LAEGRKGLSVKIAAEVLAFGIGAWIIAGFAIGARQSRIATARRVRRRKMERLEPELLDKMPETWVTEAEEDFDAEQAAGVRRLEIQRRRQLRNIETGGPRRDRGA
jgi:hypothetical protein